MSYLFIIFLLQVKKKMRKNWKLVSRSKWESSQRGLGVHFPGSLRSHGKRQRWWWAVGPHIKCNEVGPNFNYLLTPRSFPTDIRWARPLCIQITVQAHSQWALLFDMYCWIWCGPDKMGPMTRTRPSRLTWPMTFPVSSSFLLFFYLLIYWDLTTFLLALFMFFWEFYWL